MRKIKDWEKGLIIVFLIIVGVIFLFISFKINPIDFLRDSWPAIVSVIFFFIPLILLYSLTIKTIKLKEDYFLFLLKRGTELFLIVIIGAVIIQHIILPQYEYKSDTDISYDNQISQDNNLILQFKNTGETRIKELKFRISSFCSPEYLLDTNYSQSIKEGEQFEINAIDLLSSPLNFQLSKTYNYSTNKSWDEIKIILKEYNLSQKEEEEKEDCNEQITHYNSESGISDGLNWTNAYWHRGIYESHLNITEEQTCSLSILFSSRDWEKTIPIDYQYKEDLEASISAYFDINCTNIETSNLYLHNYNDLSYSHLLFY